MQYFYTKNFQQQFVSHSLSLNVFQLIHMLSFAQGWRCVLMHGTSSLRNKLRSIRLVWVTAVTLQKLLGVKNLKSVNQYNYLGTVLYSELSDNKEIQRQLQ